MLTSSIKSSMIRVLKNGSGMYGRASMPRARRCTLRFRRRTGRWVVWEEERPSWCWEDGDNGEDGQENQVRCKTGERD